MNGKTIATNYENKEICSLQLISYQMNDNLPWPRIVPIYSYLTSSTSTK